MSVTGTEAQWHEAWVLKHWFQTNLGEVTCFTVSRCPDVCFLLSLCSVWRLALSTVTRQRSGSWAWFGSTLTPTSTRRWPHLQETFTDSPCLTSSTSCSPRWALLPKTSQNQTDITSFNLAVLCVPRFPSYQTSPGSNRVFQPKISSTLVWETWIQESSTFLTSHPLRATTDNLRRTKKRTDQPSDYHPQSSTANVAKTVASTLALTDLTIKLFWVVTLNFTRSLVLMWTFFAIKPNDFKRFFHFHSCILKLLGVKVFSMSDVDQLGVARVMEETCDYLSAK